MQVEGILGKGAGKKENYWMGDVDKIFHSAPTQDVTWNSP